MGKAMPIHLALEPEKKFKVSESLWVWSRGLGSGLE